MYGTEYQEQGKRLCQNAEADDILAHFYSKLCALSLISASAWFTDVEVVKNPNKHIDIGTDILDWWPVATIDERCSVLSSKGILGVFWDTYKGVITTLDWMYEHRNDRNAIAWTWIMSTVWRLDNLHYSIRERLHSNVYCWFLEHCPLETPWFHTVKHTTPVDAEELVVHEKSISLFSPSDVADLAAILALVCTTAWKPVHIVKIEQAITLTGDRS